MIPQLKLPCTLSSLDHIEPSHRGSTTSSILSYQHIGVSNQESSYPLNIANINESTLAAPSTPELTSLSLKLPPCPLCKGQRYSFTAYFHNSKIFPKPPHDFLPFIEQSYVLKNHLQSLLVTYVMRDLEDGCRQEAENQIVSWSRDVEKLVEKIVAFTPGFELERGPLDEVQKWTREMKSQIQESLAGVKRLEVQRDRLVALLLEFKKLWEAAWRVYLLDGKSSHLLCNGM